MTKIRSDIFIRVSPEKKKEIQAYRDALSENINMKVSTSAYMLWLHDQYRDKLIIATKRED